MSGAQIGKVSISANSSDVAIKRSALRKAMNLLVD